MVVDSAAPARAARLVDEYLVVAAQAGDRAAFDHLVRRWHRKLVAHAWRLTGRREIAEEVAQSAWLDIVRGLSGLRDECAFPAWAYRIVTRAAAKRVGEIGADRARSSALKIEEADPDGEAPLRAADALRLRRAIATLSPSHRATIALHYFEHLSLAEVAVALAVPVGTVKTRLMHARARLRAHFFQRRRP